MLGDTSIDTLEKDSHKFLGSTITFSGKTNETFELIRDYLSTRLSRIDNMLIRNEYKLKIYTKYLLPSSRFLLTVHDLCKSHLDKLDELCHRYLKKWAGLSRSATPHILHLEEFTAIKSIRELYYESHCSAYISTRTKGDIIVNHALDTRLEREQKWKNKSSSISYADSIYQKTISTDPETEKPKSAKQMIHTEFQNYHSDHIHSLMIQGDYIRIVKAMETDLDWKSSIYNLPKGLLKFILNAVLNTLPTNHNLSLWGKRQSSKCKHCNSTEYLSHVLSGCKVMLDQGRYTWRHDSVLTYIKQFLTSIVPQNSEITSDLNGTHHTIPADILPSSDRPDLTIVNRVKKTIHIFELTVPFEHNIDRQHSYKTNKYASLITDLNSIGYTPIFCAFEVGCRGKISKENSKRLFEFTKGINPKETRKVKQICKDLTTIASLCSFYIFKVKDNPSWENLSPLSWRPLQNGK